MEFQLLLPIAHSQSKKATLKKNKCTAEKCTQAISSIFSFSKWPQL